MSTYTKETYSEVCEFLGLLGAYYINKLPSKLVELFEENKSENYKPHINPNIPIKEQSLSEDTLAIIAILNLQYWCEDKQEIERLKEVYQKNEEKYTTDDIFKNKRKQNELTTTTQMIEYKPIPFYKKWINIIKSKIAGRNRKC